MRSWDLPAVRALQSELSAADTEVPGHAVYGPIEGWVAVERPVSDGIRTVSDGTRTVARADVLVGYTIALPGRRTTLLELVVAPHARRRGYARALVDRVASATGATVLVATTPVENETATAAYAALGFEAVATLEGFYDDGSEALRLVRRE